MHNELYIPKTISVGFQDRDGTFTGKLGYVIYTDHAGKLRKEASWNSWRDHKHEPVTFDNKPQSGFTFNKGIKRDGYWGSGRSVIRVYDTRDFEFEISVDNLIGVLMHSDVSKRDIVEECVFAWHGTELILLPTNSVEYQESTKHTEKQAQKIGAKELIVGATYTIKAKKEQVVYLGRFDRYSVETIYAGDRYYATSGVEQKLKKKKGHVFIDPISRTVYVKDPVAYLAYCDSEEMHPEYANFMTHYYKCAESQPITGVRVVPKSTDSYYGRLWKEIGPNEYVSLSKRSYVHNNEKWFDVANFARYNEETTSLEFSYEERQHYYGAARHPARSLPGMHANREDVKQFLLAAHDEYAAIELATKDIKEWQERRAREAVLQQEAQVRLNCGSLHFVLKDGTNSTSHTQ